MSLHRPSCFSYRAGNLGLCPKGSTDMLAIEKDVVMLCVPCVFGRPKVSDGVGPSSSGWEGNLLSVVQGWLGT